MPTLKLDDVDLHYEVHGRGTPFLFCSATATHGDVWKFYQVPEFARDHQVIIYDQRGTGASQVRSKDFTTKRLAADAAALLAHLDAKPAIVLGHSNGGRVAQMLTATFPTKVAKLILASSGGASHGGGIPLPMCMGMVELGYEGYVREQAIELGFSKAWVAANPTELERYLAVRLAKPPSLEIYLRHVIARQDFNLGDRVKDIHVPTLLMVGDDEDHGPPGHMTHMAYAKSLAKDLPDARLSVLAGQGHYYYFSDAGNTNTIIRTFIEQK